MNEIHAYPALWLTEPASAFPEPQGRMPTGVFIACSQSGRSISPLITYRNTTQKIQKIVSLDTVKDVHVCGTKTHSNYLHYYIISPLNNPPTEALRTSCSRPSPEIMMMPSHSGSNISLISSLAWF